MKTSIGLHCEYCIIYSNKRRLPGYRCREGHRLSRWQLWHVTIVISPGLVTCDSHNGHYISEIYRVSDNYKLAEAISSDRVYHTSHRTRDKCQHMKTITGTEQTGSENIARFVLSAFWENSQYLAENLNILWEMCSEHLHLSNLLAATS